MVLFYLMSEIVVRIPKSSKSPSMPDVLELVNDTGCSDEDKKFYYVHFYDTKDKNLKLLLDIVKGLKATRVTVDGNDVDAKSFFATVFCIDKDICMGRCRHPKIRYTAICDIIDSIRVEGSVGYISDQHFSLIKPFLSVDKSNNGDYSIDKEKLIEYIMKNLIIEFEYCPIIKDKSTTYIHDIPKVLRLRPLSEGSSKVEDKSKNLDSKDYTKIDKEEWERIAEIFAEVFEKRFRRVLEESKLIER